MATLIHDLQHHAKDKYEVVAALALCFTTILNPQGWQMIHCGSGNNSWRMYHPDTGAIWYFTGYQKGKVFVRNNWFWARSSKRETISTRTDALRWAQQVKP
jgi:hypothetical protein